MLLKNNVETIIQVMGIEKGNFIIDRLKNEYPKSIYNHLVIIHTSPEVNKTWYSQMIKNNSFDNINKIITRKSRKRKKKSDNEFENDSELIEQEVMDEDSLSIDETEIALDDMAQLTHIARSRKINVPNTTTLADNNWFICPIYNGVDGLYPLIHKKLDNKKGYQIFESEVPLLRFKENLFTADNFKEWNCNSIFILERYFEKYKELGINTQSVFVQKRESDSLTTVKNILRNYELAQKSRIRCGNLLVSMILYKLGQNTYVSTKENLSKVASDDGEINEDVSENASIIDEIIKCYDKLEEKLKQVRKEKINREKTYQQITKAILDGKTDKADSIIEKYIDTIQLYKSSKIRLEKTFVNMLDLVTKDEEQEAIKVAQEYMHKKKSKYPNMTLDQALKETKILRTKDYIPNYQTYELITMYKYYCNAEYKAEKVLTSVVQKTWLWDYALGIKGMGVVATAYILAYLDFHSTVHSSSILRYLGLDQISVKPQHQPNQVITKEEQIKIVKFIFKSYNNIINRSKLTAAMPLTADNFYLYYRTDVITNWNKFKMVEKQFKEIDCKQESDIDEYVDDILETNEEFNSLVNYIWNNLTIIDISTGIGTTTQVIQKRARDKKLDRPCSTYLDSKGNIKFKVGLGYNAKVKSKLLYILFETMVKQKNEFYIKNIYTNYKNRLIQRFITNGEDPELKQNKARIKAMARRATMQIFLQKLWIYARQYFNLPLNGEGYNDAKIKNCNHLHNIGIEDPDELNK